MQVVGCMVPAGLEITGVAVLKDTGAKFLMPLGRLHEEKYIYTLSSAPYKGFSKCIGLQ